MQFKFDKSQTTSNYGIICQKHYPFTGMMVALHVPIFGEFQILQELDFGGNYNVSHSPAKSGV